MLLLMHPQAACDDSLVLLDSVPQDPSEFDTDCCVTFAIEDEEELTELLQPLKEVIRTEGHRILLTPTSFHAGGCNYVLFTCDELLPILLDIEPLVLEVYQFPLDHLEVRYVPGKLLLIHKADSSRGISPEGFSKLLYLAKQLEQFPILEKFLASLELPQLKALMVGLYEGLSAPKLLELTSLVRRVNPEKLKSYR